MTQKIISTLKNKFLNADGSINKTVLVSFITLLIVLVDQVLAIFGVTPQHQEQAVAIINTILTILGLLGFVEGSASDQVQVQNPQNPQSTPTAEVKAKVTATASQANK